MTNVVDFNKPAVKEEQTVFEAGSVVAAKVGSPNMLVLFDSSDGVVEVLFVDPMKQDYHVQATFPVDSLYQVLPAPKFDKTGHWSNMK